MAETRGFTPDQLLPPDTVKVKKLRPFSPGEFLDNQDGSRSTERTITFNIGGKEVLVPSLWMTDEGPVDLSKNPETIVRAVRSFEERTGRRFPRFNSPKEAGAFAKSRSSKGAVFTGPLQGPQ